MGEPESKANPELTINAVPFLVHSGENSTISWSADEVLSCLVSGPNFDFEGTEGEEIATNIIELSTYTLTCNTEVGVRTASVAVSIIPVFQEI